MSLNATSGGPTEVKEEEEKDNDDWEDEPEEETSAERKRRERRRRKRKTMTNSRRRRRRRCPKIRPLQFVAAKPSSPRPQPDPWGLPRAPPLGGVLDLLSSSDLRRLRVMANEAAGWRKVCCRGPLPLLGGPRFQRRRFWAEPARGRICYKRVMMCCEDNSENGHLCGTGGGDEGGEHPRPQQTNISVNSLLLSDPLVSSPLSL